MSVEPTPVEKMKFSPLPSQFIPGLHDPPKLRTPDSEKQPKSAKMPTMRVAFTGEWNLSFTLAIQLGSTRSKPIAKSILEPVKMNGGMSFAIQNMAKMRTSQLRLDRPKPMPVVAAIVVLHALISGRPVLCSVPVP